VIISAQFDLSQLVYKYVVISYLNVVIQIENVTKVSSSKKSWKPPVHKK